MYAPIAGALGGPPTLLYQFDGAARPEISVVVAAPPIVLFRRELVAQRVIGNDTALRFTLGRAVEWDISIRKNPHLMIVGLPGMGKTTCIVNICAQLASQGVTPIVFSYHEDIDAQLEEHAACLPAGPDGAGAQNDRRPNLSRRRE